MKSNKTVRLVVGIPDNKFLCEFIFKVIEDICNEDGGAVTVLPPYILNNYAHYGIVGVAIHPVTHHNSRPEMELKFDTDENKTFFILKYL